MRRVALVLLLVLGACGEDEPDPVAEPEPCARPEPDGGWYQPDLLYEQGDTLANAEEVPLHALVLDLPDGFTLDDERSFAGADGCPAFESLTATDGDATLFVTRRWLRRPTSFFEIPLSHDPEVHEDDDGTVVVRDDFAGDGNRLTAIVVSPDGVLTRAVAAGAGAPNLSGWPTTATTPPDQLTVPPQPAPLTLDELEALAREAQGAGRSTNR